MELVIYPGGVVRCVYDEAIELGALGRVSVKRASHVEPVAGGRWRADMSPVGGPVLGLFPRRSAALAAEADWLHAHWLAAASL